MKHYTSPELVDFGSIVAQTGHCSSGCDHDSIMHPDEFKSSGIALDGDSMRTIGDC